MCSATPKLYYFNSKGRAEVTRQMFKLASVKFEDIRYSFEEWGKIKSSGNSGTPFGQLPILKICKDLTICQTHAIEYYVAKKHGFLGNNLLDETRIQMISNCVDDIGAPLTQIFTLKDEEKEKAIASYENDKRDDLLGKLTVILKQNSDNSIFFLGKKLTLADLRAVSIFYMFEYLGVKYDESKFPELNKLRDHVSSLPELQTTDSKEK